MILRKTRAQPHTTLLWCPNDTSTLNSVPKEVHEVFFFFFKNRINVVFSPLASELNALKSKLLCSAINIKSMQFQPSTRAERPQINLCSAEE